MHKRYRKIAAVLLAAAMLSQGGVQTLAESTENVTEENQDAKKAEEEKKKAEEEKKKAEEEKKKAEEEARKQSEAEEARKQSEAEEARKQSEAEEARKQSEAEEARKQSEAEEARKQSEAEEARKQSEAEEARKQSEAEEAKKQSEAEEAKKQSEAEAKKQSEAEEAKKQSEEEAKKQSEKEEQKDKEKEDKKKDKKKKETERSERKNDGKKMKSSDIVSKLKSALKYLFAAESVEIPEGLEGTYQIAEGDEGAGVLKDLKDFSVKLANATTSSDVNVINVYADEDGKIDTAQLEKAFGDTKIDVTDKRCVVNVVADSKEQNLKFSGYGIKRSGGNVEYQDGAQPGDVLYNFTAMGKDGFTGYSGTVTLSDSSKLQGVILAPEATVKVNTSLAGEVFAENISVGSDVQSLVQVAFAKGIEIELPETDGTEMKEETEPEAAEENENTEKLTEAETEAGATEKEAETEVTEKVTEKETESELTEGVTEKAPDAEVTEEVTEKETESELTEGVTEKETGAEAAEAVTEKAAESETAETVSEEPSDLPETEEAEETGEELLAALSETEEEELLQVVDLLDESLYNAEGETEGSETEDGISPQAESEQQAEVVMKLNVLKADQENVPVSNATFVIEDADGNVLKDQNGEPLYTIAYAGAPAEVAGLAAGAYILAQLTTEAGYSVVPETPFEIKEGEVTELTVKNELIPAAGKTLTVTERVVYNNVILNAAAPVSGQYYAALFQAGEDGTLTRLGEVKELTFAQDAAVSNEVQFTGLAAGSYQLMATNGAGEPLTVSAVNTQVDENAQSETTANAGQTAGTNGEQTVQYLASQTVDIKDDGTDPEARMLTYVWSEGSYPEGTFYYNATIRVYKEVLNEDGKTPLETKEKFYAKIYSGESRLADQEIASLTFNMANSKTPVGVDQKVKVSSETAEFYLGETYKNGTLIPGNASDFPYGASYDSSVTVKCTAAAADGEPAAEAAVTETTITNILNPAVVKLRVVNSSGKVIPKVVLVLKDKNGKILSVGNTTTFTTGNSDIRVKGLKVGETYYLSEITAPDGYAPAEDVEFVVERGMTTIVEMKHKKAESTEYSVTATKQVFAGSHQVYAKDDTKGTNAEAGRYTFYAALFKDEGHKIKVSDVQKITVEGFVGTVTFKNLKKDTTYYIAETNANGQVLKSTTSRSIRYAAKYGKVTTSSKKATTVIQNVYSSLPSGYRYTAVLELTKAVTDAEGAAKNVAETFYAGIYKKSDYSDKPTVVELKVNGSKSDTVKRRVLLSGESDMTLYLAELHPTTKARVTDTTKDFKYTASVTDNGVIKLTKANGSTPKTVTITNKEKTDTKVTLYITKRVYNGSKKLKVADETFYAGLFKDDKFTEPYTKPIPLNLKNKSELTLKLSLSLGTAESADIYVAEVDKDGNVIKDERSFGYNIKLINSKASFTKDRKEIQTILLNSKYGTSSNGDWNNIISQPNNNIGGNVSGGGSGSGITGGGGAVSGNGEASETTAASTGDETPIALYIGLMAAAVILILLLIILKKRRKK